jgi:hypothetical protein
MDVAAWLQDLDLERYVSAFRDNDIDAEVLLKLTAEDLISIGVTSVGHRRKLLDAIAALGATASAAAVTAAPSNAPAPIEAERRQLTVMFCDLVGSTRVRPNQAAWRSPIRGRRDRGKCFRAGAKASALPGDPAAAVIQARPSDA